MVNPERRGPSHLRPLDQGNIHRFSDVRQEQKKPPRLARRGKDQVRKQAEEEKLIRQRVSDPHTGWQWRGVYEVYLEPDEYRRITGLEPFSG